MEDELQKTLMQLESGRRQMEQFGKQAQMIESAISELNMSVEALKTIKGQKQGTQVMMPVGAGSYVKGQVEDTETVLVGIGANLTVEKNLPEALQTLEYRKKKLNETLMSLQKNMGGLAVKMGELNQQAELMLAQARQQ
jgi:prefoldin alpha subunit